MPRAAIKPCIKHVLNSQLLRTPGVSIEACHAPALSAKAEAQHIFCPKLGIFRSWLLRDDLLDLPDERGTMAPHSMTAQLPSWHALRSGCSGPSHTWGVVRCGPSAMASAMHRRKTELNSSTMWSYAEHGTLLLYVVCCILCGARLFQHSL